MSGTTAPLRAVPYDRYNGTIGAIFSHMVCSSMAAHSIWLLGDEMLVLSTGTILVFPFRLAGMMARPFLQDTYTLSVLLDITDVTSVSIE